MTIWILAIVVIGLFIAAGYFQGGISATVTLLGVILAGYLALPLAPLLKPLFPAVGLTTNTVWLWLWPPVLAFTLVVLIAAGLGFAAQRPVTLHYKYRADDLQRHRFERLNASLGACVGALSGFVCMLMVGVAIYVPGYLTVQFANDTSDPAWLRFLNSARMDMQSSGLDRLVRPFDPAPKRYYEVADTLGLIYQNNPAIVAPLSEYPPFLLLSERQELKDIGGDKDLMESLQGKATLADLITNPKILAVINNQALSQELLQLDLADMNSFIKTGKSAKYDSMKILGRWELDGDAVIVQAKRSRPGIKASELATLRKILATMAAGTTFKATTDNRMVLVSKGMVVDLSKLAEIRAAMQAAANPRPTPPPGESLGSPTSISAAMRARYGGRYGQAPTPPPAPVAPQPTPLKMEEKTLTGSWEGDGDNYQLKIQEGGRELDTVATIEDDELTFTLSGQPFVFVRM